MARWAPTLKGFFRGSSGRDDDEGEAGSPGRGVRLVERANVVKQDGSEDQDSVRDRSEEVDFSADRSDAADPETPEA